MAPWNPLQFLQQQGARAQRAIQNIPRMAGQVQQQIQPIIRTVTNSPVVRPVVQQYRRIPPSVRSAVNPLSTAQPVRWPGAARSLGANLLVDTLVEEAATRLLPTSCRSYRFLYVYVFTLRGSPSTASWVRGSEAHPGRRYRRSNNGTNS
jgi:hypothetical protein